MSIRSRLAKLGRRRKSASPLDQLLASIEIPSPFDINELCEQLSTQRGRHIYLHPVPGQAGSEMPCGTWFATDVGDHVFYEETTTPLHQEHIILHELSHMLLGHNSIVGADGVPQAAGIFGEDIDPATIRSMLGRTSYTTPEEQDAERLATLIARRAGRPAPTGRLLHRLEDALG